MQIEEIKNKLRKKAVQFQTGGARPGNVFSQSWIGKVKLGYKEEVCPLDANQQPMLPLMQLCLSDLPLIPEILQNTKILTVFISSDFIEDPEGNFCIREYPNLENLVEKDFEGSKDFDGYFKGIKPFPLFPQLIENDFPLYYEGHISNDLIDIIRRMKKEEGIEYLEDIYEESKIMHKIGGYANYDLEGHRFETGYKYVFQIASDYKANLEIRDSGDIYFGKNPATNQWQAFWTDY